MVVRQRTRANSSSYKVNLSSRQAQVFSEQTQELGEEARQAAQQAMLGVYDRVLESARRGEGEQSCQSGSTRKTSACVKLGSE